MIYYAIYRLDDGRIVSIGSCDASLVDAQIDAFGVGLYGVAQGQHDPVSAYWNGASIEQRPDLPVTVNKTTILADQTDLFQITGIPLGTNVVWPDGVKETVDDGVIEFTTDTPDAYSFIFTNFPYKDTAITVEATNAAP